MVHSDLDVNTVSKEIENIATKHNTGLADHVNSENSSLADPISLHLSFQIEVLRPN